MREIAREIEGEGERKWMSRENEKRLEGKKTIPNHYVPKISLSDSINWPTDEHQKCMIQQRNSLIE